MAKEEEIIIIKVQTDLKQPVQSIDELQKRMKLLKKTLKESPKEGTKAFEDLAKKISSKTGVSIDKARGQILEFQKTATKEIQKGTNSLKQFNAELREIPANANSIQSLRNQVKRLDKEVSQLDTSTQEFVDKSQELRKTRDRLKELEAATGDARRNVGNYTDAIKKAIASNLNFSKRLNGISKTLKIAFGLSSVRLAIGAFGRLYDSIIERNGEADDKLQGLQKSTGNLTNSFLELATDGLKFIAAPLTKFINAIAFTFDKVRELAGGNTFLGKTFAFVGRVITGVLGALGKFPAFFSGIVAGAQQLATNVKTSFQKLGVSIQILSQQINQFNPFSSQTTEEIEANISKLRDKQLELANSTKTVAQAYDDAFKSTIAQQEAYNKEVDAQKVVTKGDKKRVTALQSLEKQQKSLQDQIKNLITRNKDYSKQQEQLRVVTEKLTGIQEQFNTATNFTETQLEKLTAKQQSLTASIKERLLAGEDVSAQIKELTQVTKELTGVDSEFEAINKAIEQSLADIAEGSLKDYENQLSALKDQQEGLNITSQEYIDLQSEINKVSSKQNLIIELTSQNTAELIEQQKSLNAELSDGQAQQAAVEAALERISKVTDATGVGAEQIKQIEEQLAEELKQINLRRLSANRNVLAAEIEELEIAKQKELELVEGNEQLKLAIEQKFENEKTQLQIERLGLNAQLLDAELEKEKQKNAESLADTKETETAKTAAIKQGLSAIGQAANGIFQIISNLQQQAFEKQSEQLKAQEEAALRNAELTGANEKRKQAIRDKFAKKEEQLEKEQAEKKKAIAITQAVIQTALAVATAATLPPPASYAAMAIAAALGAIQIGIIATQKFQLGDIFDMNTRSSSGNKFEKGTYLSQGAYHSSGGMPIINPYTGQKVAEIEKDEAIVNRRTMKSNRVVTMTGKPYDIVSSLNSMQGFGVSYPNARSLPTKAAKGGKFGGGYSRVKKPARLNYGNGGRFGVSSNVLKLQQGAIVASSVIRQAERIEADSTSTKLLEIIAAELQGIKETNKAGFENATTTPEDLEKIAQLQKDLENAS